MGGKLWKPVLSQFIGGCILGAILGLGIAICIGALFIILVVGPTGYRGRIEYFVALPVFLAVPSCAIGLGYYLAKREYTEQLESTRLHSHFCKRCGYDLRGCVDIVCPECGTGISDKQRRHITEMIEKAPN